MPRLESLIATEKDPLLLILTRWTAIVGRRNRKVLFPKNYDTSKQILRVAVPNSMVRAQYEPLLALIVEKAAQVLPCVPIKKIILSVEPRYFERRQERVERPDRVIVPDQEAVIRARQRLVEKGVSVRFIETLAYIEAMLTQSRNADK